MSHPRRQFHITAGGRTARVSIFDGHALCTCGGAAEVDDCPHIHHATRLLTEPCRVALERILEGWLRHGACLTPEDTRAFALDALNAARDGIRHDNDRIHHMLSDLEERISPASRAERHASAIAVFEMSAREQSIEARRAAIWDETSKTLGGDAA